MACGVIPFSITSLLSCFFPIFTGRYWFISIYFAMYLLSPFLNKFIACLDRKKHAVLNIVLFVYMSIWSSFGPLIEGAASGDGFSLSWFIVLYFTGSWMRLYYKPNRKLLIRIIFLVCIPLLMTMSLFASETIRIPYIRTTVLSWLSYNSIPVYIATLLFFSVFLNIRSINSKCAKSIILFASPLTYGIYLIHNHPDIIPRLWIYIPLANYTTSPLFPLIQLGSCVAIFIICLSIDKVRTLLFFPLENSQHIHLLCSKLTNKISRFLE